MKKGWILIPILTAAGWLALSNTANGEMIEGRVLELQPWRNTFQLCTEAVNCNLDMGPLYLIGEDTEIDGASNLRDLRLGDRVVVEGEPVHDGLWKVQSVTRQKK